jgi:hypothetical protein
MSERVIELSLHDFARLLDEWAGETAGVSKIHMYRRPEGKVGGAGAPHFLIDQEGRLRTERSLDATGDEPLTVILAGAEDVDEPTVEQEEAALWVASLLQDRFGLEVDSLRIHGSADASASDFSRRLRARRGSRPPGEKAGARAVGLDFVGGDVTARRRAHVINLWGGKLSTGGAYQTTQEHIDHIFEVELPRRIQAATTAAPLPIVLYAHGGLNDEAAGLAIADNQIPWWLANGCYPLMFVWETGFFETIARLLGAQRVVRDLSDISDAALETLVRGLNGGKVWDGMKYAAEVAFQDGMAGAQIIDRLAQFVARSNGRAKIWAVGHSAGSIFHAHLARRLHQGGRARIENMLWLAPAITIADYKRLVDGLIGSTVGGLTLFTMDRKHELADTVAVYQKSLLYLIYYALERNREEPVLGLEDSLRADADMRKRLGLEGAGHGGEIIWSPTAKKSGRSASESVSHGGFDNDPPTMESVVRRILSRGDDDPVTAFPPDTESRSLSPQSLEAAFAAPPVPAPAAPVIPAAARAARRALCVGINAYPTPNALNGCVADAGAWEEALSRRGFEIMRLHDAEATRANLIARMEAMVRDARAGDVLAFQYAGHGSTVPDLDDDERGNGQDQTLCPVDFGTGDMLIDDDIRKILNRLPSGAHMTLFMDCCHSDTNTRFAVGRAAAPADSRARFLLLSADVIERYKARRSGARGVAAIAAPPGGQEAMRWVSFAACKTDQVAYETRGRGDFSNRTVPLLLAAADGLSNRQFQEQVLAAFGPARRQDPRLDCASADLDGVFLFGSAAPLHGIGRESGVETTEAPSASLSPVQRRALSGLLASMSELVR